MAGRFNLDKDRTRNDEDNQGGDDAYMGIISGSGVGLRVYCTMGGNNGIPWIDAEHLSFLDNVFSYIR